MNKPCEYCGKDLPRGVDLRTRRIRSRHFAACETRLQQQHAALIAEHQALESAQQSLVWPQEREYPTADITESEEHYARRQAYAEGWNDCLEQCQKMFGNHKLSKII